MTRELRRLSAALSSHRAGHLGRMFVGPPHDLARADHDLAIVEHQDQHGTLTAQAHV